MGLADRTRLVRNYNAGLSTGKQARPDAGESDTRMPPKLKWTDAEDLGILLHERMPTTDPLSVRFTDLHRWVCALPEFDDDPQASSEGKLEAIQMAWLEEFQTAR